MRLLHRQRRRLPGKVQRKGGPGCRRDWAGRAGCPSRAVPALNTLALPCNRWAPDPGCFVAGPSNKPSLCWWSGPSGALRSQGRRGCQTGGRPGLEDKGTAQCLPDVALLRGCADCQGGSRSWGVRGGRSRAGGSVLGRGLSVPAGQCVHVLHHVEAHGQWRDDQGAASSQRTRL